MNCFMSTGYSESVLKMKHQGPNANIQKSTKLQYSGERLRRRGLGFGVWNFSGAWMLVFGG